MELITAINKMEKNLAVLEADAPDLINITIETHDVDKYITITQTALGWITDIRLMPGTLQKLGYEETMYRINELFEASAARVANCLFLQCAGKEFIDAYMS